MLSATSTRHLVNLALTFAVIGTPLQRGLARSRSDSLPTVTQRINELVRRQWNDHGLKPSAPATDGEWCRRLFLDVVGRIPTVAELDAFDQDRRPEKRQALVRSLLHDEEYVPEYVRNWTTIWTNLLIGRSGGTERNSLVSRDGMQQYLRDAFAENRAYDRIIMDLVTAEGTNTPGTGKFNGAVNFLAMKLDEKAVQASSETAKLFLGKQVQCTQCHNHPFNEWKQNQFWELTAFFQQTVALRRFVPDARMVSHVELTDQDYAGEGSTPWEAEMYYELRNGTLESAYPVFIDGTPLANRSGLIRDVRRRQELGRLIVASREMPRAIVNRLWGHFLGYGFTTPVDDMGPHNPPTHPELLDELASAFASHSFDLKQLLEWIVLSEPYSLSSRMNQSNAADDPTLGERPMFSHFYLRQMGAEVLYESLLVATGAAKSKQNLDQQEPSKRDWLRQFTVAFGTDEGGEGTTFNGTVPQTLMLFNGELMKQALRTEPGSLLDQVARQPTPFPAKINHLFRAALARNATRQEGLAAQQLVRWREGNLGEGLQDVWWAVLNSNEFVLNH